MRSISYRSKVRLRKGLKIGLAALGLGLLCLALFVVYLGRYVVYTPEGAKLDFGRDTSKDMILAPETQATANPVASVHIEYADPSQRGDGSVPVSGWYIDLEMLQDPQAVLEGVRALEPGCTVMMDLKGANGSFYYSSSIPGARQADIDIATVDAVISNLRNRGFTMVARIRSFTDSAYALEHIGSSLRTAGGALWVGGGFYWLDPAKEDVVAYLKQIARELGEKGFKEIVFDDFRFPNGNQIAYDKEVDRDALVEGVAKDLMNYFASSNITVSFGNPTGSLSVPARSHVYLSNVAGSGVSAALGGYPNLEDPQSQIVFLTGSKDKRFEGCQLLRPLLSKLIQ